MTYANTDLIQARSHWARLRLNYLKGFVMQGMTSAEGEPAAAAVDAEAKEKNERLSDACDRWGRICYSIPAVRPFVHAWMVDIKFGTEVPGSKMPLPESGEITHEALEGLIDQLVEDPDGFTDATGGAIVGAIRRHLLLFAIPITDRGFGNGGGHIGCPCTDNERDYIMTALWSKWNKAIQHGLIMPVVAWFKPKFRNLWSEDECVKWLEEHPDNLE